MRINILNTPIPVDMLLRLKENGLRLELKGNAIDKARHARNKRNGIDDELPNQDIIEPIGKAHADYCFGNDGKFPKLTALFDADEVIYDTTDLDKSWPLKYEYNSCPYTDISAIMEPVLDELQKYIDAAKKGEMGENIEILHTLDCLFIERITIDTDDWTADFVFGS